MMETYRRVEDISRFDRTHKVGAVKSNYQKLKAVFGEPGEGEGYKVSMEWLLEDSKGRLFSIYDWKMSNLYDENEGGLSPAEVNYEFIMAVIPIFRGDVSSSKNSRTLTS